MLDVLVHCHDFEAFSSGPQYAAKLASELGASLTGIYVAPGLQSPPAFIARSSLAAEFLAYAHEELERAQLARHAFTRWAAQNGARSSHWQLALGDVSKALIAAGNCADMIVVEHRARVSFDSLPAIGKTLLSGVPCVVIPEAAANARPAWKRIGIAWNGSAGAVRAIHAALPLLRMAGEIHLLSAPTHTHRPHASREPAFSIERYFERHGLVAKRTPIDPKHGQLDEALLIESSRLAIDLLVMGAFGTTRFRDSQPQGITRRVIEQSLLPVFLRH